MTKASNQQMIANARTMRDLFLRLAVVGAFASLVTFTVQEAQARPGGGFKGGAGMPGGGGAGMPRGGGGIGRAGIPQRQPGQRPAIGNGQRPAMPGLPGGDTGVAAGNGNTGIAGNRTGNTGVVGSGNGTTGIAGNRNGNTGVVGSGTTKAAGNGNTGVVNNGNVVAGNDVDVNVDNGWGGNWTGDYPAGAAYATGVAVGTTTAAVVGSYHSTLPAGCSPHAWAGRYYYSCGTSWYQQTSSNGSTVYVVVSDPRK